MKFYIGENKQFVRSNKSSFRVSLCAADREQEVVKQLLFHLVVKKLV